MPKVITLTDDTREQILNLRDEGLSYKKIKDELPHLSIYKIQQVIKNPIPEENPTGKYKKKVSDEDIINVLNLRGEGLSYRKINHELPHLSIYKIRHIIKSE